MEHAREQYEVSERHACRLLGQWRRTQRYAAIQRIDEEALTEAIVALASEYGRYGYRRITALLQRAGWHVGKDRVQRIWRREGLKVPQKQRPRGRLWLNDGSCVRLRPERANHVWSYDFVSGRTHDGRTLRILTLIDEYTRESLAIRVAPSRSASWRPSRVRFVAQTSMPAARPSFPGFKERKANIAPNRNCGIGSPVRFGLVRERTKVSGTLSRFASSVVCITLKPAMACLCL